MTTFKLLLSMKWKYNRLDYVFFLLFTLFIYGFLIIFIVIEDVDNGILFMVNMVLWLLFLIKGKNISFLSFDGYFNQQIIVKDGNRYGLSNNLRLLNITKIDYVKANIIYAVMKLTIFIIPFILIAFFFHLGWDVVKQSFFIFFILPKIIMDCITVFHVNDQLGVTYSGSKFKKDRLSNKEYFAMKYKSKSYTLYRLYFSLYVIGFLCYFVAVCPAFWQWYNIQFRWLLTLGVILCVPYTIFAYSLTIGADYEL